MKPLRWQSEVELSVNSIHQKNAYAQHRRGRAAYSARRCHCYSFLSCGWHFPVVPDSMRVRMVKRWAPRLLRVLGIRLDVKGRIPNAEAASGLREDGPGYLVCANHISFADIFVLDSILPVRFIAKKKFQSGRFSD